MKTLFTILFLFSLLTIKAQSYVLNWSSGGHTKYVVQQSTNGSTWTTLGTVTAKVTDTSFSYTLPTSSALKYFQVVADAYTGRAIYIPNIPPCPNVQFTYEIKLPTK